MNDEIAGSFLVLSVVISLTFMSYLPLVGYFLVLGVYKLATNVS